MALWINGVRQESPIVPHTAECPKCKATERERNEREDFRVFVIFILGWCVVWYLLAARFIAPHFDVRFIP